MPGSRKSMQRLAVESEMARAASAGEKLNSAALARELQVELVYVRTIMDEVLNPRPPGKGRFGHRVAGRTRPPLAADNRAVVDGRTLFPTRIFQAEVGAKILKSGMHSRKLGHHVTKGRWRGMPIYSLTLEERATCPRSCDHWRDCYGSNMQFAHRMDHRGEDFERALAGNVVALQRQCPEGFVVRLHTLGDFYSVRYVKLWRALLETCPALRIFGYTARIDSRDEISRELSCLARDCWDRFALRFSNAPFDECSTVTIEHPVEKPPDAIVCPAQTGRTANCGTCALCWGTRRRIAFLRH